MGYGHQAGDAVLRELALVAESALRASDMLFRWGGEEFALIAPSTGHRGGQRLAQHLCLRVAGTTFPAVGKLTVSAGVGEHLDDESGKDWFRRVDAMLYRAKSEGRNRVCTDARGNSDAWAAGQEHSALCLVWQEAYECGEAQIDREHRELFDLANVLIQAAISGDDDPLRVGPALDSLLDHVARHFSHEEALLEQVGYARLEAHRHAHAGLLSRAGELRDAVANGQASLGSMVEFLAKDVVARHLFRADRDFYPLFSPGTARRDTGPILEA
jgi:hemerythrin-like metal-binding protein